MPSGSFQGTVEVFNKEVSGFCLLCVEKAVLALIIISQILASVLISGQLRKWANA